MSRQTTSMAKSVRVFFDALINEGFDEHQALTLTAAWLTAITRAST